MGVSGFSKSNLIKIYNNCEIDETVDIGEFSVIGKPSRLRDMESEYTEILKNQLNWITHIGSKTRIGTHVLIEEGAFLGNKCIVESHVIIEAGAKIDDKTIIVGNAKILGNSEIGEDCVIGGVVSEHSLVGNRCRVFGNLIHKQSSPNISWDNNIEEAPRLKSDVFVGIGANLIGNISISSHVYVSAGAIVTKSIPSNSVVIGANKIIPIKDWKGNLSDSLFWKEQ